MKSVVMCLQAWEVETPWEMLTLFVRLVSKEDAIND